MNWSPWRLLPAVINVFPRRHVRIVGPHIRGASGYGLPVLLFPHVNSESIFGVLMFSQDRIDRYRQTNSAIELVCRHCEPRAGA